MEGITLIVNDETEEWAKQKKSEDIEKSMELLERGINMGGIISKKRGDLHAR